MSIINYKIEISPSLFKDHKNYLLAFHTIRHMKREEKNMMLFMDVIREKVGLPLGKDGEFFVGDFSNENNDSRKNFNALIGIQPSIWCPWKPDEKENLLIIDEHIIFYEYYIYIEWIEYMISKFFIPWQYKLNGFITYWDKIDKTVKIENNKIKEG